MKIKLLLSMLSIFAFTKSHAQDLMTDSRDYVEAYFNEDTETCARYLHDSVTWMDPTFSEISPNNHAVTGKAEVLAHLEAMGEQITNLGFDIEQHFVSADVAVFEGIMKYSWTDPEINKRYDFSIREVTILQYKDGKVYRHTDHADFKTWRKQYEAQLPKE